jgi:glycosyltransferase involved in cell wall biosynthesis
VRVALVYDCLYPATIGGAERWLRRLAERLSLEHDVTYLTRRQWGRAEDPIPGVRCVAVSPGGGLYRPDGSRRPLPPLLFGLGVFLHLLRRRGSYDVVHCLSFPYLSLIATQVALAGTGTRVVCEWLECLSDEYWRSYGRVEGRVGRALERLCVRLTPEAVVFSRLSARRLRERGLRSEPVLLGGLAEVGPEHGTGAHHPDDERDDTPLVLFVGRHTADKRVTALPRAIAIARQARPGRRAVIAGDGPQREQVIAIVRALGLADAIDVPGFVRGDELEALYERAACVVSPSRRDGFGMAVADAAARGVPVVVCAAPDNAAVERIVEGENGSIAPSAAPEDVAAAIGRVLDGGAALRQRTARWFGENAASLSIDGSIERARALYADPVAGQAPTGGGRL